jgi:16S rRNA C1402 N4-methylase RsmH
MNGDRDDELWQRFTAFAIHVNTELAHIEAGLKRIEQRLNEVQQRRSDHVEQR